MNYMPTIQVRKMDKLVRSDNTADKTENIWFKKMKIVDELKFLAAVRAVYAGDILHGKEHGEQIFQYLQHQLVSTRQRWDRLYKRNQYTYRYHYHQYDIKGTSSGSVRLKQYLQKSAPRRLPKSGIFYAPTHDVAPSAVSIADAIDAIS